VVKNWIPRPYQPIMISFVIALLRCCLFVPMGMGKTSAILAAIDALMLAGSVNKTLVLAPKRVARSTWPDEAKKWKEFSHLRIKPVAWTIAEAAYLKQREIVRRLQTRDPKSKDPMTREAIAKKALLLPAARAARLELVANCDVMTVNYDILPQLIAIIGDWWPFDMVVADEATRLKSFRIKQGGKRAAALSHVAHKTKRWVNLTGTPAPNGLQDLWGQMWFVDEGMRLGRTYTDFQDRWFGFKRIADAHNPSKGYVSRIVFPHAQAEIEAKLKDVCLTLDVKDWFDLREPIVANIFVDLTGDARKKYEEMEDDMFTQLAEGNAIEAFNAASRSLKCLQLANGAAYVDEDGNWIETHQEKIEALESIVEEAAGMPVLVAYHFKSDLARLQRAFPQARVLDADPQTILDWNEGRIPLLFSHPASAGHGLNLQDGGNILVFFAHWWALEERLQIIERIGPVRQAQAGHDRPTYIYNILARDTVDELVIERIETKREVQDLLLEAMKRKEHVRVPA
jgi:SNF2 family DNA or RNA helicase